jgi:hypothetical protein
MSFLESVQHGLEKASQEAARITKIQHLHNVATDLGFKASQEGQTLIAKAMEMYHSGLLAQGDLVVICQQIATFQQQINEIHEEIQRLQSSQEEPQGAPFPPASYPVYPPAPGAQAYAPGVVPPGYPAYPASPASYPAYAAPANSVGYPAQPTPPQAGYPPYAGAYPQPGFPAAPVASPSGEPPTKPGAPVQEVGVNTQEPAVSTEPPTRPGSPAPEAATSADVPSSFEPTSTSAPGSYAQGALPPIFSPFTNHSASTGNAEAQVEAEPEKPASVHHRAKKAATEPAESEVPAKEKKAHKAAEPQA